MERTDKNSKKSRGRTRSKASRNVADRGKGNKRNDAAGTWNREEKKSKFL